MGYYGNTVRSLHAKTQSVARWGETMRDDTNPDWRSRISHARFEARDFCRTLVAAYVVSAGAAVGVLAIAFWLLGVSMSVLLMIAVASTIVGVGTVITEMAHRHYVQCAYIEMTVSHIEAEIKSVHERLDGIAHNSEMAASLVKTHRPRDPF